MSNLKLWKTVCETDPKYTKQIPIKGGLTDICSTYQIKRATELWGPYGGKWGLFDCKYQVIMDGNGTPVSVLLQGEFRYDGGLFPIAVDTPFTPKGEWAKCMQTMAIGKALSRLGFSADVYQGRFDDSAYVKEMENKYGGSDNNKPATAPNKPSAKVIPDPTPEEAHVLGLLGGKYDEVKEAGTIVDFKLLCQRVYEKFGKYPSKAESIPKILEFINVADVTVRNDFLEGV